MTLFQDAFISYGRADSKTFAAHLNQKLVSKGLRVWFDFEDIPLGVDYQKQIDDGIEKADNFLFIISPHSINSPYCRLEVELAQTLNKRIIPLLHVEEISRDVWQQRNPKGSETEWQAYKAEGKHTCFANMLPIISKINWVYFREGQDNYEQGIQGLLNICQRQREYVHRHTVFLTQALAWDRNQKQTNFLLLGEERQTAEAWLQHKFQTEQPPCVPTDLHCEFITESIKNANNMMTQVFLAHASADRPVMEKIRRSLQRQGITVWTDHTDIRTGEAFKQAIRHGIEEADNLVYLLSPNGLTCKYCTYELNYALSLNKRIIPILVSPVKAQALPDALASLQCIDLTDNIDADDYASDESELIKVLRQDSAYYARHKAILVKALKWQQQDQNPSILLRGYDLSQSDVWLKTAQGRVLQRPTPLQQEFIQASLEQPPISSVDVFISYSSADGDLARKLNDALQTQGKTTWFDQESIAAGTADFQQEIYRGIEASDNIVFILSPRSVSSPYCGSEVEYAAQLNKRFITILYQPVEAKTLHPELAKVQWLDFSQQRGNFTTHFNHLIRTLDTDRDHVQNHTKWLLRSLDWQQQNRNPDLLLRGSEYAIAHQWLKTTRQTQKIPLVTAGQQAFIEASQKAIEKSVQQEKRQNVILKSLLTAVSFLLVTAGVIGGVALVQGRWLRLNAKADRVRRSLPTQPVEGLIESLTLVHQSNAAVKSVPSVQSALRDAIGTITERDRLIGHQERVWSTVFSPDGKYIASGGFDRTIRLWTQEGILLRQLKGHTDDIWTVAFSPDSQVIASGSSDGTVRLWDVEGNAIGAPIQANQGHIKSVAFSPDGRFIAIGTQNGILRRWDRQTQSWASSFSFPTSEAIIWSVAFSPDGSQIAAGNGAGLVQIWSLQGKRLATLQGPESRINAVAFRPDGRAIATGSDDNTVRLWSLPTDTNSTTSPINIQNQILYRHEDNVMSVAFSPDGRWLASGSDDNRILLQDHQRGTLAPPLVGHRYYVYSVAFSPDSQTLVSSSEDHTVRLWDIPTISRRIPIRTTHPVKTLAVLPVSADSSTEFRPLIISGGRAFEGDTAQGYYSDSGENGEKNTKPQNQGVIKLWTWDGRQIGTWRGHNAPVTALATNADGTTVISGDAKGYIRVWSSPNWSSPNSPQANATRYTSSSVAAKEQHGNLIKAIAIHPTQELFATASDDTAIQLWDFQGKPIGSPFQGHEDSINTLAFSPSGDTLASGSADHTIRLWDLQGNALGKPMGTIRGTPTTDPTGHTDDVNAIAFSPDGQSLVSASRDQSLRLWSLATQQEISEPFFGHTSTIKAVTFSSDGQTIISGSRDQTLQIWNLNGTPIGSPLIGHGASVNVITMSPDGKWIVSGGDDGSIQKWEGGFTPDWVEQGCDRIQQHSLRNDVPSNTTRSPEKTCD